MNDVNIILFKALLDLIYWIMIINICINADVLFAKQGSESKTYADRLSCWIA